jgi:hypothetical protein
MERDEVEAKEDEGELGSRQACGTSWKHPPNLTC